MNIILLSIWVKIAFITCLCIYYNKMIVDKYLKSVTPVQPEGSIGCVYQNIPTLDISKLEKCKSVNGIQTYIYTINGINYIITPTEQFYIKACTGFCVDGLTPTNNCKTPANQKLFEQCETLLQPDSGCLSSAKPVLNVTDGTQKQYYYVLAPVNSLSTCS